MDQTQFTAVDEYLTNLFVPEDPILEAALQDMTNAGLPQIQVTPTQGKLLAILVQAIQARFVLEIGTLGAYSTIWMARAMPSNGKLITLELDPKHAEVARKNLARAKVEDRVEVRVGPALESLSRLAAEGGAPFDFVFIDADKQNMTAYFQWAMRLTHSGSLIVADNVVRQGEVIHTDSTDPKAQGTRESNAAMAAEPGVVATAIQTVSRKHWDGFAIALVK